MDLLPMEKDISTSFPLRTYQKTVSSFWQHAHTLTISILPGCGIFVVIFCSQSRRVIMTEAPLAKKFVNVIVLMLLEVVIPKNVKDIHFSNWTAQPVCVRVLVIALLECQQQRDICPGYMTAIVRLLFPLNVNTPWFLTFAFSIPYYFQLHFYFCLLVSFLLTVLWMCGVLERTCY